MTNEQACQHKIKYTRETGSDGNFYWVQEPSCQLCEIAQLRGNLSLAEEVLASAMQEIERLKKDLRRANAALVRHCVEQIRPGNAPDEPNPQPSALEREFSESPVTPIVEAALQKLGAQSLGDPWEAKMLGKWPLPPDVLADAQQDVVHQDTGAVRAGHSDFEAIREDYQNLTGVCPLPESPLKKSPYNPIEWGFTGHIDKPGEYRFRIQWSGNPEQLPFFSWSGPSKKSEGGQ